MKNPGGIGHARSYAGAWRDVSRETGLPTETRQGARL